MLDIIANVLYIGAVTISEVNLYPTHDVAPQELHAIAPVEFRAVSTIWSDVYKCRFYGVAIPVERDWEEVVENGYVKTVLPPEPGKVYTYAVLVNKKSCPDKPDEHMFSTGTEMGNYAKLGLPKGIKFIATGLSKEPERQPKWLPQALKVIEDAAEANPAAKEFLDFTASAAQGTTPAAPEKSAKAD